MTAAQTSCSFLRGGRQAGPGRCRINPDCRRGVVITAQPIATTWRPRRSRLEKATSERRFLEPAPSFSAAHDARQADTCVQLPIAHICGRTSSRRKSRSPQRAFAPRPTSRLRRRPRCRASLPAGRAVRRRAREAGAPSPATAPATRCIVDGRRRPTEEKTQSPIVRTLLRSLSHGRGMNRAERRTSAGFHHGHHYL